MKGNTLMSSRHLRIVEWEVEGLRCPDHKIMFGRNNTSALWPCTLIQMPNGTGKTTTLQLIKAALSGVNDGAEWTPDDVRAMAKRGADNDTGRFRISLLHDERRLTITMSFDFEEGSVSYATTLPSGMKAGFSPPPVLRRFLRPEIIAFLVFDGELAQHLINREHSNARSVIDGLFQIHSVSRLMKHVQDYWEAKTAKVTAKKLRGLARRRNKVKRLQTLVEKRERAQGRVEADFSSVSRLRAEKEAKFRDALVAREDHLERIQAADKRYRRAVERKRAVTADIVRIIKNPCAFSGVVTSALGALKLALDQAKLPESAAREFFTELSQQPVCVCGRPLDSETRSAIRTRAVEYLGSDDVALLNAMKASIADAKSSNPPPHAVLDRLSTQLVVELRRVGEHRTTLAEIEEEAAAGDPRLEAVHDEIEELRKREQQLNARRKKFHDPTETAGDNETTGIAVLRRRRAVAERKLAEITNTIEIRDKRDVVTALLERARSTARETLGAMICSEANDRVRRLMPNNRIRIKEVNRFLSLDGQEAGSTGENLGVAYAFLASLFSRSEFTLPVVVDSPANPIDLEVRAQVGRLIPNLSKQFVAFTISSERRGFLEALEDVANHKIQYVTLFRKGEEGLEGRARMEQHVRETTDGMLVEGRRFFRKFQLDEE